MFKTMTALIVLGFVLGGCAQRIVQTPADLDSARPANAAAAVVADADTQIRSSVGVARTVARGTVWDYAGRIGEGIVYIPRDTVLTVEGADVSEAYLVLRDAQIVGFYLPVQGTFSPVSEPVPAQFSTTR